MNMVVYYCTYVCLGVRESERLGFPSVQACLPVCPRFGHPYTCLYGMIRYGCILNKSCDRTNKFYVLKKFLSRT